MLFFDFAMLLPLIAFVMGCLVFVGIGLIVLSRDIPKMRLTFVNLLLFVVGAFLGTFALELLYGRIFADVGNHLRNTVVVFGQIPVMLIGAVGGGAGTVCLRTRIKLIAGLFLLVLIAGGFWFLYAPAHWLTPFTGTVTVDERPTPADLYIGNPTDSEAQAIAFVHVPGVGDYFFNFEEEKYREASSQEFMRFKRGVWTFAPMNQGQFVVPLPFRRINEFHIATSNGHTVAVQF